MLLLFFLPREEKLTFCFGLTLLGELFWLMGVYIASEIILLERGNIGSLDRLSRLSFGLISL